MERADHFYIERARLFEKRHNLRTVFSDDIRVISSCLVEIIAHEVHFIGKYRAVESAEGAERVGGEKYSAHGIERNHNFGPVNHRCHHKIKRMMSRIEGIAFFDDNKSVVIAEIEELLYHREYFRIAYYFHIGIAQHKLRKRRGMVRLHMVNHDIIELSFPESMRHIFKEYFRNGFIDRVKEHCLVIAKKI